jgi:hypothetical protein
MEDEQAGQDQNQLVANLEVFEIGQRHVKQHARGDHQHDVGECRCKRHYGISNCLGLSNGGDLRP